MQTTIDGLLNRRVALEQPKGGYRVAVDTVLLASAVPASSGERVLDMGCGVGGAMLCLASRVSGLSVVGMEIQEDLVRLCAANIERNNFNHIARVESGDVTNLPPGLYGAFDHVMINPPYHETEDHTLPPNEIKKIANAEIEGDLVRWIESAAKALKSDGTITLIHRADRLDEIVNILKVHFGGLEIKPIVSKPGASAKRILVRAKAGKTFSVKQCEPLVMHGVETKYTDDAENILRHAKAIRFE